jgi:hypothetical protein
MDQYGTTLQDSIVRVRNDPSQLASVLAQLRSAKTLSGTQKAYAETVLQQAAGYENTRRQAQQQLNQVNQQYGGTDANGNPTSPWP